MMPPPNKHIIILFACILLPITKVNADTPSDDHIKAIVRELLQQKDSKIDALEAKIQQLKQKLLLQEQTNKPFAITADKTSQLTNAIEQKTESSDSDVLTDISSSIKDFDTVAKQNGLDISGFFDVSAQTQNKSGNTFTLGAVELDLEYSYDDHFAVSSAFVWDGSTAAIGVAVLDFHMFNDSIPARGRIFSGQGFHIQGGGVFQDSFRLNYLSCFLNP
ncbi:MAG: hypothetical protein IBX55_22365, partial [Methyloprofundus sp.]|nr:hypothetical protein [Methyloprofundus sp.]